MAETDIGSAEASDMTNTVQDFTVASETTDAAGEQKETEWQSTTWTDYLGYYKTIPELKTAIDTKANWIIGAGFSSDPQTELLLNTIKGNGKDSFNSILKNQIIVSMIDGDSYAEIIRDKDGVFVNLKPLSPDSIKSVQNRQGRYIRYEQVTKNKIPNKEFKPEEIFHLSRERIADEIHGISVVKSVEWIILARNEAMNDWKKVLHRNVQPLWVFHLDTDDTTEISAFKTKMDNARKDGENMYIPKGTVEPELVSPAINATLNPLTWINQLNDYFFQAVNTPQIIIGNAKEFTDASGKIVYLAFEQSVKAGQLYVEEQVLAQLNLEIHLTFPASLQNELLSDEAKQPGIEKAAQPNDTTAELEGKA